MTPISVASDYISTWRWRVLILLQMNHQNVIHEHYLPHQVLHDQSDIEAYFRSVHPTTFYVLHCLITNIHIQLFSLPPSILVLF